MSHKNQMGGKKTSGKPFAARRTMNPPNAGRSRGVTNNRGVRQQDASGRLGAFAGTGSHPRTGNAGHQ
jgi:hypothetical protein